MGAKETTENFWEVWNNFKWPEIKPITYRLYYHKDGSPDFYTMEDLPGDYIEVTQEIYISSPGNVRVVNGELKIIPVPKIYQKLQPNLESGTPCNTHDVCVVTTGDAPVTYWKLQAHEIN